MRARSAAAAAVVVLAALAIVAVGLLVFLRSSLLASASAAATSRVDQIAAQLASDAPSGQDLALLAAGGSQSSVQIIRTDGSVLLGFPDGAREPMISALAPGARTAVDAASIPGQQGTYAISARGVDGPGGALTVAVAVDVHDVSAAVTTLAVVLVVAVPLLVVIVAALTWVLVGRSLRPVDDMRSHADAISTADLSRRLPVPQPADEIARLAVTLNLMLSRLQSGHEGQRRFIADASHELRSPLSTLRTALELGSRDPDFLSSDVVGSRLLPEVLRMETLVSDLLLLARTDERHLRPRLVDVDLDELVAQEAERLRTPDGPVIRASSTPVRIRGDVGQLRRLLRNLGDNAIRYARAEIVLSCMQSVEGVALTVSDDGPGISEHDRSRVFDRFVRLDSDRSRAAGGYGLGLAIVAQIAAAHQAAVRVERSAAGGALFIVTIPQSDAAAVVTAPVDTRSREQFR